MILRHLYRPPLMALSLLLIAPQIAAAQSYDCAHTYCSRMTSCGEAAYKLMVCGDTARDGDGDGIPCEKLCGTSMGTFKRLLAQQWPAGLKRMLARTPSPPARRATGAGAEPRTRALASIGQGSPPNTLADIAPFADAARADARFTCGRKRYCREMESCAEARFYLKRCKARRLDGNRDGIPCNRLCRGR
ncbi:MAG: excalibur calcium-binding domain-containing protein [Pseudomonadota bacterium]